MQVCGIIGALLAASPGAVDYFKTVPPNSSAKKRATKHALLNITNLVLFLIAWILKGNNINPYVILVLELIGIILLAIAGWLGGTLVYRNQIGVDPRYANAGKWKEEEKDETKGQIEVASADELKTDQMKLIHVNDKRIVIARTEKGYVAFDDHCTHKGGSLAGGAMICETVQCPWHGSQFDVNTGAVKAGPAKEKINTYNVSETNGKVYLNL
jgi:nitrite reductase/ring-hydroxylating ferredoxin subunit